MPELSRQQLLELEALDRVSKYLRSISSNVHELPPEISRIFGLLTDAQRNLTEAVEIQLSSQPRRSLITPEHMWEQAIKQVEQALVEVKQSHMDQRTGQLATKGDQA